MKRHILMEDLDKAKASRERANAGVGDSFYDRQRQLLNAWSLGGHPPKKLILGELPQCRFPSRRFPSRRLLRHADTQMTDRYSALNLEGLPEAELAEVNDNNVDSGHAPKVHGLRGIFTGGTTMEVATTNRQNLVDKGGSENRYLHIPNLWFGLRFAYLVSGLSPAHQEMIKAMAMELLKLERLEKGKMFLEGDCEGPPMLMFTDREREILNYIAEGHPDRRIALKMAWSVPTVKRCVGLILRKLGAANRTQAAVVALRQGLIEERNEERVPY